MRVGPDCAERKTLLIGIDVLLQGAIVTTVLSTESGTILVIGLPRGMHHWQARPTCRHAWSRLLYRVTTENPVPCLVDPRAAGRILVSRCSLFLKGFAGSRPISRDRQFKSGLRNCELSASTQIQSQSAYSDVSGRSATPRGVNQFLLIRTIHEQLIVRNFQYSSMP